MNLKDAAANLNQAHPEDILILAAFGSAQTVFGIYFKLQ